MRYSACIFSLLAFILLAVSLSSCSIKEDRDPCPCYLRVAFEDRSVIDDDVCIIGWRDGELFRRTIDVSKYDPYWITAVHKGMLQVVTCMGLDEMISDGHYAVIPYGSQCDSLYSFFADVDATGDDVLVESSLKKQFATVHVDISRSAAEMKDYRFRVTGNSCGFDLLDFSPLEGDFMYVPVPAPGQRVVDFRIPRQKDSSLSLAVWRGDDEIGSFPIGDYVRRLGYKWDTKELQDIYLTIDFIIGHVIIGIDNWEDGVVMTFIEQ